VQLAQLNPLKKLSAASFKIYDSMWWKHISHKRKKNKLIPLKKIIKGSITCSRDA
jgi:hypothetical protein